MTSYNGKLKREKILELGLNLDDIIMEALVVIDIVPNSAKGMNVGFFSKCVYVDGLENNQIPESYRSNVNKIVDFIELNYMKKNCESFVQEPPLYQDGGIIDLIVDESNREADGIAVKLQALDESNYVSNITMETRECEVSVALYDRDVVPRYHVFPLIVFPGRKFTIYDYYYEKYGQGMDSYVVSILDNVPYLEARRLSRVNKVFFSSFLFSNYRARKANRDLQAYAVLENSLSEMEWREDYEGSYDRLFSTSAVMKRVSLGDSVTSRINSCYTHDVISCRQCFVIDTKCDELKKWEGSQYTDAYVRQMFNEFFSLVRPMFPMISKYFDFRGFVHAPSQVLAFVMVRSIYAEFGCVDHEQVFKVSWLNYLPYERFLRVFRDVCEVGTCWWFYYVNNIRPEAFFRYSFAFPNPLKVSAGLEHRKMDAYRNRKRRFLVPRNPRIYRSIGTTSKGVMCVNIYNTVVGGVHPSYKMRGVGLICARENKRYKIIWNEYERNEAHAMDFNRDEMGNVFL